MKTKRAGQWAVHPRGVRWLSERLHGYDAITGPQGVPPDEYERELKRKQRNYRRDLASTYLSKFRDYRLEDYLPAVPSKDEIKKAEMVSQHKHILFYYH